MKKKLEDVNQLKPVNLRNFDRRSLKEKTKRVNEAIGKLESETIGDTNNLILAGANTVADLIETKVPKKKNETKRMWLWLKKGYLKKETEGLIVAAQDQALRRKWIRRNIDKEKISAKCRLCSENDETIAHVLSECKQLAQNEYKKGRHDKIAAAIHWHLCKKYGFQCGEKSHHHFVKIIVSLRMMKSKFCGTSASKRNRKLSTTGLT